MYSKTDLQKRREELSTTKKELLAKRLQTATQNKSNWQAIPRRAEGSIIPLSFAQQRLWFLQQLEPENPLYNETAVLRLKGPLDITIVQKVINEIARRHEILRTSFVQVDGEVQQIVHPPGHLSTAIQIIELQGSTPEQSEANAMDWIQQETEQPFSMSEQPLWSVFALLIGPQDALLFFKMHHIICDSYSLGILFRELFLIYAGVAQGTYTLGSTPALQYADYTLWQRQHLTGPTLEALVTYWQRQLARISAPTELLLDHPRQFQGDNLEQSLSFDFSPAQAQLLHSTCQKEGVTLFLLFLTALAVILARYTRQDEVVIGTASSGRTSPQLEETFGLFVSMLPLRVQLAGNPTLREILQQTRKLAMEAYAHQDIPFEKLVENAHIRHTTGQNPLFQMVLDLQPSSLRREVDSLYEVAGVHITRVATVRSGRAKFDLTLMISEHEKELSGQLIYNRNLWEAESMRRLLEYWQRALQALLSNPDQHLSELTLLTPEERLEQLERWSQAHHPLYTLSLSEHLELQANLTPERVALVFEDLSLTYFALNQRANQLAHYFAAAGVTPETCIALYMERSPLFLIALLAILKVGGCYVPLDPLYPAARLTFLLQDCQAPFLLLQERLREQLPAYSGTLLVIDTPAFQAELAACDTQNLSWKPDPHQAAYSIYTSGTTGQPKGVVITHLAIVNHALNMCEAFDLQATDRVLQFASLTFDASLEQILTTLLSGATLLLKDTALWHTHDLHRFLHTMAATVSNLPTAYWHRWLQDMLALPTELDLPTTLRMVIVGGDKIQPEAARAWLQLPSGAAIHLLNAYGPTEATITTSFSPIVDPASAALAYASVPIGSPLPDRTYYVLDQRGEPVLPGAAGELYIGGPLLARGYFQRPELTAERFVPDPFGQVRGSRLYRTGDMVRLHNDGSLEVLGRADFQVKVRGFRLELGEIEAVLLEHPQIKEAVVITREDEQEEKYLAAYVTTRPESEPEIAALQQYLQTRLPHYMIPAHIAILESLPLTPAGKLDRQALPRTTTMLNVQAVYSAPQTQLEIALADIWRELLAVPQVGQYDSFFALGGHSLLSMQLVSRILQQLHRKLPLQAVFAHPTLVRMAEYLLQCPLETTREAVPAMADPSGEENPQGTERLVLPASFHQQRLWFLDQLQPDQEQYNLSLAVQMQGRLDIAVLERCLNTLVQRHESLRTIFISQDEPQQVILPALTVQLSQHDLQLADDAETREALQAAAHQPFHLAKGPLLRASLFHLGSQEYVFLLSMHHIITDGWSIHLLVRELLTLYAAFIQQRPSPLAPLTLQYRHYTRWQLAWLEDERLQEQLHYWQQQLQGTPPLLALPTDYPRTAHTGQTGSQQSLALSAESVARLLALSATEQVTLSTTLLAAWQLFLQRISGQSDLVIGIPHLGRPRVEFEQVIGFFANMLPLRLKLDGTQTFQQLLQHVHRVALEAYTHADIPFEKLVQALHIEPDLSYHPLFQVEFGLQKDLLDLAELRQQRTALPDLSVQGLQLEISQVKLDLACFFLSSDQGPNQGLTLTIEYNTDLFRPETITRLLRYFQTLLSEIGLAPDKPLSRLALLSACERADILARSAHRQESASPALQREQGNLFQRFTEMAIRNPEALAVVAGEQQLTYRDLLQSSQRLAGILATYDVGPESLVALLGERSLDFLLIILALFCLDAAYLPLDPYAPAQRHWQLLEQSRASLVLTAERYAASFSLEHASRQSIRPAVLTFETLLARASDRPATDRALTTNGEHDPHQLAYVIYTSGSTGLPKGAMIEQQGMLNHLQAKLTDLHLTAEDIVAQTASQTFDISVWQFLAPLLSGGQVHIFSDEIARDPARLLHHLQSEQITVLETVPSLLRAMLNEIAQNPQTRPALSNLRWLLLTGEALPPDICHLWTATYPHIQVMNAYGPTECSDDVTHYILPASLPETWYAIPIGRAIAQTQVYVFDPEMQPVPPGVIGEVYCGGIGVGRGYLAEPQRTAEIFLPHPFSSEVGARLYKTGDLARYLPDGNLEYCGRSDQQVKIRGVRIEPGEIESVIRQLPVVREAVVISKKQPDANDLYLLAYLVPTGVGQLNIETLIQSLKERLPEHLIPERFVMLAALPLNANGKIDYAALPEPGPRQPEHTIFARPRSATEEVIARIWAEILKLDPTQIGVHSSFFSLGGHSLLATQVMARLRRIFHRDLPLRSFFDHATIADFSHFLSTDIREPEKIEKIARLFQRIEHMNEHEMRQLLQTKKRNL